MSLGNPSICRRVYKEGKTKCYDVSTRTGDITFSGRCPEYFALEHGERILNCINCIKYGSLNGHQFAMCVNCGEETGAQRGFINFAQECDDETSFHRPSVFDTYLSDKYDWNLTQIGDKLRENTIHNMVYELYDYLCEKFGYEEEIDIRGLCDYLFSLDHNPKEAFYRINEARDIPYEQLYDRNWAYLFGPHFDSNDDYIGDHDDDTECDTNENPLHVDYDYKMTNARETQETQEEEERQCEASSQSSTHYSSMPALIPILTRTDTEYHYGLDQNDSESEVDYRMYLSDRRRGASFDADDDDDDAVSEISNGDVGEVDNAHLTAEQQDKIYQVIEDACVNSIP